MEPLIFNPDVEGATQVRCRSTSFPGHAAVVKREDLLCSICFDILCFPVTLPCGHNFDRGCILRAWEHNAISNVNTTDSQNDEDDEEERDPYRRHTNTTVHACPLCRQLVGVQQSEDLHVNLLLKDLIATLYPTEIKTVATLEKQDSVNDQHNITSNSTAVTADPNTSRRSTFRTFTSFAYVYLASITDPPGFILAVLLLLALIALGCSPQQVVSNSFMTLNQVFNVFAVLIHEISYRINQLDQVWHWIHAFSLFL